MTTKLLITLPDDLSSRLKAFVPSRERSKFLSKLLETELQKHEDVLRQIARDVEKEEATNPEAKKEKLDWGHTIADGLDD